MVFLLLALSAIVPSLLLVWYFQARDVYPEPPRVLWTTFGLGIAIVFPVVLVALPLDSLAEGLQNPLAYGFTSAFLGAAIPEELFKLLVLWRYAARHIEFDEPMDGIVYGATASLGFATLENVLYVADGGVGVAVGRALTAVPGHAFLGAIMGYYVGQAKFAAGGKAALLRKAALVPIVLHGLYDWPLLAAERIGELETSAEVMAALLVPLAPAIVIFEWVWTVRLVRRLRQGQLVGTAPAPEAAEPPPAPAAAVPAPAAPSPAAAAPAARPGRASSWALTLLGGLLASGGALFAVAVMVGLAFETDTTDRLEVALGGCILAGLPLVAGLVLFSLGVVRLNRARRR